MKLLTTPPQVLDDSEMETIWDAALRIWAEVPLRVQGTPEFNDALSDLGCEIDGERVTFPEPVRDVVLDRIQKQRQQQGTWRPAQVQQTELKYTASGQALYACEIETDELRPATSDDLASFSHICDAFDGLGRSHPTFIPQDVPADTCDLHTFALIAKNSSRLWPVSVYNAEMVKFFIEIQKATGDSEEQVRKDPAFHAKCWYNSPFMITEENIRIGMEARRLLERPFEISCMPVAGIATPATLSGCLAHITAEVLGCNAISLALDDRLIGWCTGPLTFDMKTGIHTQTGPADDLLRIGSAQMGTYVFGGEYVVYGGPTTAAKVPGAQSMMEKSLCALSGILGGIRGFGSLGILVFADIGSVTQLMLDLEMMSYFERLLQGIEVDAEHIAEEVIKEVAPRGAYFLSEPHTARHYRDELWIPELMDRRVPMAWIEKPQTMLENARAKAKRVAAGAKNKCPLSDDQLARIDEIVTEADRYARTLQTR